MAYDQYTAERITHILEEKKIDFFPKKMFGGLTFMVDEKMCIGLMSQKSSDTPRLMCRISPEEYEKALKDENCSAEMMGRTIKGFIFVNPDGFDREADLENWVQKCLDFNPLAKKSKKKAKK